jgi:hypothetical protein
MSLVPSGVTEGGDELYLSATPPHPKVPTDKELCQVLISFPSLIQCKVEIQSMVLNMLVRNVSYITT